MEGIKNEQRKDSCKNVTARDMEEIEKAFNERLEEGIVM